MKVDRAVLLQACVPLGLQPSFGMRDIVAQHEFRAIEPRLANEHMRVPYFEIRRDRSFQFAPTGVVLKIPSIGRDFEKGMIDSRLLVPQSPEDIGVIDPDIGEIKPVGPKESPPR